MSKKAVIFCFVFCAAVLLAPAGRNFGNGAASREGLAAPQISSVTRTRTSLSAERAKRARETALRLLTRHEFAKPVDGAFLLWADQNVAADFSISLAKALAESPDGEIFYGLFGETLHVLWDRFKGAENIVRLTEENEGHGPVTLAFTGDVNLADDWENMLAFRVRDPGGAAGSAVSPELLSRMRAADIFMLNNEFCFSDRGTKAQGKRYTFRAATANVRLYKDLGADIVSVANNHVFDYGEEAFLDTLSTLDAAGIRYAGGGKDLLEAMRPRYFHAGGMKLAYIAAAETAGYLFTPAAKNNSPGLLSCYEDDALLKSVAAARKNADWVIVYLHWGVEYEVYPEPRQAELARALVDAGADIITGAHPHVLQGIEFYAGKPIAYSLGNFWFNVGWVDSALLEVELEGPGQYALRVLPCATEGGTVRLMRDGGERLSLLRYLDAISSGAVIAEDGTVTGI